MNRPATDIRQKGREFTVDNGSIGAHSAAKEKKSSFTLQIGAFRDPVEAAGMVKKWQKRCYTVFSGSGADDDDSLTRVYIGKFNNPAAANAGAAALEDSDNIKAYITLLPETDFN